MYKTRFIVLIGDTGIKLRSPEVELPFPPLCASGTGILLAEQVFGRCEDAHWDPADNSFELFVQVESYAPKREKEYHLEVLTELLKEAGYEDAPDEDE